MSERKLGPIWEMSRLKGHRAVENMHYVALVPESESAGLLELLLRLDHSSEGRDGSTSACGSSESLWNVAVLMLGSPAIRRMREAGLTPTEDMLACAKECHGHLEGDSTSDLLECVHSMRHSTVHFFDADVRVAMKAGRLAWPKSGRGALPRWTLEAAGLPTDTALTGLTHLAATNGSAAFLLAALCWEGEHLREVVPALVGAPTEALAAVMRVGVPQSVLDEVDDACGGSLTELITVL